VLYQVALFLLQRVDLRLLLSLARLSYVHRRLQSQQLQ